MQRLWRNLWLTPACAALLGASACGDHGEKVLATITIEAGVPEAAAKCVQPFVDASDMGLDLYFVIDDSFTLDRSVWGAVGFELADLLSTSEFAGVGLGFAVYPAMPVPQGCVDDCGPDPDCGCLENHCDCVNADPGPVGCRCNEWPTSCDDEDYAPWLEIARLSEGKLLNALSERPLPQGGPALRAALLGSLRYRNDWENMHSGRRITQVLVTTSPFADCGDRISDSERVLAGENKPKTYVVGLNLSEQNMDYDRLAVAGRTDVAFRIRTKPPNVTQPGTITKLVRQIRDTDGRCEYLPPKDADLDKINLKVRSGGKPFPHVQSIEDCVLSPLAWYYDRSQPGEPPRMIACEAACKLLRNPGGAQIQAGCPTVVDGGP